MEHVGNSNGGDPQRAPEERGGKGNSESGQTGSLVDTLSAVLSPDSSRIADSGAASGHPFQRSWLIKPATIVSMLLSVVFLSMSAILLWYGIMDRNPPIQVISGVVTGADQKTGVLEITFKFKKNRYCHGQRYGFIHDRYSFSIDPVEIPPEGFRGPSPSDGVITRTIPVDIKNYFWQEPDGFTYRAEWRFRCNPLQGTLFPEIVVSSPDIVVPHS